MLTDAQWKALSEDIADRRGLKWEWAKIDDDIKQEIRRRWSEILERTQPVSPLRHVGCGGIVSCDSSNGWASYSCTKCRASNLRDGQFETVIEVSQPVSPQDESGIVEKALAYPTPEELADLWNEAALAVIDNDDRRAVSWDRLIERLLRNRRKRLAPKQAPSLQDKIEKILLIECGPEIGTPKLERAAAEIIALVKESQ